MKSIRSIMAGLAVVAMGIPAMASGGDAPKPLKSTAMIKADICDEIGNLKLNDFKLTDETVDIYFTINSEGDVIVNSVDGNNCMVTGYVSQMLKEKKMYVAEELQNVKHHIKVRYVVI